LDFRKGSELETKDINRYYNVARALERVQGSAREQLETFRVDARMAALAEAERVRKARYEAIQREEARVLLRQAEEAAAMAAKDKPENAGAESADDDSNPFASDAEKKSSGKKGMEAGGDDSGDNPVVPGSEKKPAPGEKKAPAEKPEEKPDEGGDIFDK
jgi:hypothetical protein